MIFNKVKLGIVNMNCNNLYSIFNSCKKIGYKTSIINKSKNLKKYDLIILPGVGSFNQAINFLKKENFDTEIPNYLELKNRGILGICLGMQLFFESSEEFGLSKGLGIVKGKVLKFRKNNDKIPHIGWNEVNFKKNKFLFGNNLKKKNFYFVHSFFCNPKNKKDILTLTRYNNINFCSSIFKKNILATQFHPEKSGKYGVKFLKRITKIL